MKLQRKKKGYVVVIIDGARNIHIKQGWREVQGYERNTT
jgi:hypothetical protein